MAQLQWGDIAKVIAPLAPTLGGLLGGFIPFPGASIAGQALGNVIAKQFGVEATPAAVAAAIQSNPNEVVLAKLTAATEEAKVQWPAIARIEEAHARLAEAALTQTNETMRQEKPHWFFTGWRAASGWAFWLYAMVFGGILMVAAVKEISVSATPLKALSDAWPLFAAYFGALAAMVGVLIVGRKNDAAMPSAVAPAQVPAATKAPVVKNK